MSDLAPRVASLERAIRGIPSRWGVRPVLTPIRIGRGNLIYSSGAYAIYGAKGNQTPTSVSAGMWNATTKKWIPADTTWDAGICYGYITDTDIVAVAQTFNGVSGLVAPQYSMTEGTIIYSKTIVTYTLGADVLQIYLPDQF